eukprot:Gb_40168 [translate_table: standard]
MKFEDKFWKYIHGGCSRYSYLDSEYLENILKNCHLRHPQGSTVRDSDSDSEPAGAQYGEGSTFPSLPCRACDNIFFYHLTRQVSAIAASFASGARRLFRPDLSPGYPRYLWRVKHLLITDYHQRMLEEARSLIMYVAMNAMAVDRVLEKYDRAHHSINGQRFKSILRAKNIELLKSPWLVELFAFHLNSRGPEGADSKEIFPGCVCKFGGNEGFIVTCRLRDLGILEFNLTCAICLDILFDPIALKCGHIFCNSCACTNASVPTILGVKLASRRAKCPLCRQMGVHANSVHLIQTGLLLKKRQMQKLLEGKIENRESITCEASKGTLGPLFLKLYGLKAITECMVGVVDDV